jgi:hypothetical protein
LWWRKVKWLLFSYYMFNLSHALVCKSWLFVFINICLFFVNLMFLVLQLAFLINIC